MTGLALVCVGVAAEIIGRFIGRAGKGVVAAAAEDFAFQRVVPLFLVRLGIARLIGLGQLKRVLIHNGRVVIGNDIPFAPILHAAVCATHLQHGAFADHIGADIPLVLQHPQDGRAVPNPMCPGNIVCMVAMRGLVLTRGRDTAPVKLPCDLCGVYAIGRELKDQPHHFGGLRVRLHAAIGAFAVAVGTYLALILATLHLGILGALGLDTDQEILDQNATEAINGFSALSQLKAGKEIACVFEFEDKQFPLIASLDESFFRCEQDRFVGQAYLLCKVIKKIPKGQSIKLDEIFDDVKKLPLNRAQRRNMPKNMENPVELRDVIKGPALAVLPIAVYQ